jgi:hypothetical protein
MNARILPVLLLVVAAGCAKTKDQPPPPEAPAADVSTPAAAPAFAGKTWKVTQSSAVAAGTTYEFREGGTLVVSSPGSPPLTGSWAWSEGKLTMTEEGISYPTDILALDDHTFRIRSKNPGEPVEITLERDRP